MVQEEIIQIPNELLFENLNTTIETLGSMEPSKEKLKIIDNYYTIIHQINNLLDTSIESNNLDIKEMQKKAQEYTNNLEESVYKNTKLALELTLTQSNLENVVNYKTSLNYVSSFIEDTIFNDYTTKEQLNKKPLFEGKSVAFIEKGKDNLFVKTDFKKTAKYFYSNIKKEEVKLQYKKIDSMASEGFDVFQVKTKSKNIIPITLVQLTTNHLKNLFIKTNPIYSSGFYEDDFEEEQTYEKMPIDTNSTMYR